MGFYVRFDDIRSVNEITGQQMQKWKDELTSVQEAMQKVIDLESFEGETANSIKAYYNEVHRLLLSAVCATVADFSTKFFLYWNRYYDIDTDIHTKLNEDTMNLAIAEYDTSLSNLSASQNSLKSALDAVSDVFYSGMPFVGMLENNHDEAKETVKTVRDKVTPYEESVLNGDLKNLQELIENTLAYIREYKNSDRNIMLNYTYGDYIYDENIYHLAISMQKVQEYQEIHQGELEEAIGRQEKVYEQLQAEYEAEKERLAKERADQGGAQVVMGIGVVAVGIAAIVFSAGTATPAVAAGVAVVAGTCSTLYGASEVIEGTQHVYYGLNGDPYTSAINPIRDTVFMGNQEAYNLWGNLSVTVAGLCIPAGTAMKGLKGIEAVKAGTKAVVKSYVIDQTTGFVADKTTQIVADQMGIQSETAKALINMGIEQGLECGIEKIEIYHEINQIKADADASGKGLGGLMDESDASRYDAYWSNLENNTLNGTVKVEITPVTDDMNIHLDDKVPMDSNGVNVDGNTSAADTNAWKPESGKYEPVQYEGTVKVGGEEIDVSRRVYQKTDIDPYYVDPNTGKTNLELMEEGRAPYGSDGKKVELHHVTQTEPGTMVEITDTQHSEYYKQLHGLVEDGNSFRNDPVKKKQYNNFREKYWKWRAQQIKGGA